MASDADDSNRQPFRVVSSCHGAIRRWDRPGGRWCIPRGAGKLGAREPPSSPPGRCIYRAEGRRDAEGKGARDGDSRSAGAGAGRRWRGVPGADRAAPAGAAGALLPDARLHRRRRGRRPGDDAGRLARPRQVHRGTRLATHLAVHDRHQPVPERPPRREPPPGQGVGHVQVRTARADPARRGRLAAAVPGRPPRRRRRGGRAGGPLRAERSDLAGLRDRPAAAAAPPGRRPDLAGRPRLPRPRGSRHAGRDRRLGQQHPQTSPRQPPAPAAPATSRRPPLAHPPRTRSWPGSSARGRRPTSVRWWPC